MKKVMLVIAFVAVGIVSCKNEKKDKTEAKNEVKVEETKTTPTPEKKEEVKQGNVDTASSKIAWKGTKPTGFHNGTVSLKNGNLIVSEGKVTGGEFVVDMNSILCEDLKAGDGKKDLEDHLKNADFFNVEKFPTSKFTITSVQEKAGKLNVTGNLQIKDITKSVSFPVTVSENEGVISFKSDTFNIDRTDFGVQYKSKKFFKKLKDKFIDDLIEFSFDVKAKK